MPPPDPRAERFQLRRLHHRPESRGDLLPLFDRWPQLHGALWVRARWPMGRPGHPCGGPPAVPPGRRLVLQDDGRPRHRPRVDHLHTGRARLLDPLLRGRAWESSRTATTSSSATSSSRVPTRRLLRVLAGLPSPVRPHSGPPPDPLRRRHRLHRDRRRPLRRPGGGCRCGVVHRPPARRPFRRHRGRGGGDRGARRPGRPAGSIPWSAARRSSASSTGMSPSPR